MNIPRRFRRISALCAMLLFSGGAIALSQEATAPKSASEVVKTHPFVSLDPVPRGKEVQAAIVVDIANGYHMNSHKPLDSYLIPTTLTPQLPAGITLADTAYPAGHNEKFPFSPDKPLNVYTKSVTFRMKLSAESGAKLGATTIPVVLRYQACNNSACLPPVKVPVSVELQVVAAGATSKPMHPEIFSAGPTK